MAVKCVDFELNPTSCWPSHICCLMNWADINYTWMSEPIDPGTYLRDLYLGIGFLEAIFVYFLVYLICSADNIRRKSWIIHVFDFWGQTSLEPHLSVAHYWEHYQPLGTCNWLCVCWNWHVPLCSVWEGLSRVIVYLNTARSKSSCGCVCSVYNCGSLCTQRVTFTKSAFKQPPS